MMEERIILRRPHTNATSTVLVSRDSRGARDRTHGL